GVQTVTRMVPFCPAEGADPEWKIVSGASIERSAVTRGTPGFWRCTTQRTAGKRRRSSDWRIENCESDRLPARYNTSGRSSSLSPSTADSGTWDASPLSAEETEE